MANQVLGMPILEDNSIIQRYNVGDLPVYICKEQLTDFAGKKTVPHWNDGLESIYVQSGSMSIILNGIRYRLNPQDLCVIHAGCVHYLESIDNENCVYFCNVIEESLFSSFESIVSKYLNPLFHSFHPSAEILRGNDPQSSLVHEVIRKINTLNKTLPPAYELHIISLFHEYLALLYELLDTAPLLASSVNTQKDSTMKAMLNYIQQNYSQPIHIETLCDIGKLSRNQCYSVFQKYTGDTPGDFILKYRLDISRGMLAHSATPIAQIATNCGFTHQSHFTSHFSRYYGITPAQFRKNRADG